MQTKHRHYNSLTNVGRTLNQSGRVPQPRNSRSLDRRGHLCSCRRTSREWASAREVNSWHRRCSVHPLRCEEWARIMQKSMKIKEINCFFSRRTSKISPTTLKPHTNTSKNSIDRASSSLSSASTRSTSSISGRVQVILTRSTNNITTQPIQLIVLNRRWKILQARNYRTHWMRAVAQVSCSVKLCGDSSDDSLS